MNQLGRELASLALAAAVVGGTCVQAQAGAFEPPQLVQRGTSSTGIPGPGSVVVQVLVRPDGGFRVQKVIRSSNPSDNAAALDIARHSTYRPARRDGKPTEAYYDYTLAFTGGGGSASDQQSIAAVFPYEQLVRAGKYAQAKSGLQGYLTNHPSDTRALTFLGVADFFLGDTAGAVAAFNRVPKIVPAYEAIALKAYEDETTALSKAKNYTAAEVPERRIVALQPSFATYDNLAFIELSAGDVAASTADFETARTRAASEHASAGERATIDANLAAAYAKSGNLDRAKAMAAEAKQIDPSQNGGYVAVENVYSDQADTAMKALKYADAAASYEQAAAIAPTDAVTDYVNAAFAQIQEKTPDGYTAAKVDADKALAIDPNSAGANFAEGIILANEGKHDDAVTYLNKADAAAKAGTDTSLTANIENVLKQLNSAPK